MTSFILHTIVEHGPAAERLCNKVRNISESLLSLTVQDPLALKHGNYLTRLFPSSKWIFMVRDGRAVVHSVIKR